MLETLIRNITTQETDHQTFQHHYPSSNSEPSNRDTYYLMLTTTSITPEQTHALLQTLPTRPDVTYLTTSIPGTFIYSVRKRGTPRTPEKREGIERRFCIDEETITWIEEKMQDPASITTLTLRKGQAKNRRTTNLTLTAKKGVLTVTDFSFSTTQLAPGTTGEKIITKQRATYTPETIVRPFST